MNINHLIEISFSLGLFINAALFIPQCMRILSNKDAKYIHAKKDTPDLCSAENLNGCKEICYNAIKSLDLRVE